MFKKWKEKETDKAARYVIAGICFGISICLIWASGYAAGASACLKR